MGTAERIAEKGLQPSAPGDIIVFYSGLRPVTSCDHVLVYALVGLYEVAESVRAGSVPTDRWKENAHTRCVNLESTDVIVRARRGVSGRLKRCIPIGEFRTRAYRVEDRILAEWGGLSCKDGYLQRSAVLPTLLAPRRFMQWFEKRGPELVTGNNA